jgi:hypothetical protein
MREAMSIADKTRRLLVFLAICSAPARIAAAQPQPLQNEPAADVVTERLFREYVVGRGRIPTASVNAAIELIAARGINPPFIKTVLTEFEKSCEGGDSARTIRRNLLEMISKMLAAEGSRRWHYEEARHTRSGELSAAIVTPGPSPDSDKLLYAESEMLSRLIARGRQADRHEIDAFALAVRQAHHPQGKEFLLDVLRNPPDSRGKWPDNVGGAWLDAKFHAAVGLAELGEHVGVEWLIEQSRSNDFGVGSMSVSLSCAPHHKATRGNLRESCLHALADLLGQPATDRTAPLVAWWTANKSRFEPRPVALQTQ